MRYLLLLTLCCLFGLNAKAQSSSEKTIQNSEKAEFIEGPLALPKQEIIFTVVEQMPEYKGGEEAMYKYLASNISYPSEAKENKQEGIVYISFVVMKDGSIDRAKIIRDIGYGCGLEALRVIKIMPKWNPGMNNGFPVNVEYTIPVSFLMSPK